MSGWLLILMVFISSVSSAGLAGYTMFVNLRHSLDASQTVIRLEEAENAIRLNARAIGPNGEARVPAGQASANGWTTLPSWIGAAGTTPSGVPFLYCPYVPSAGVAATSATVAESATGDTYSVEVLDVDATPIDRHYVVGGDPHSIPGLLGLLVAPAPGSGAPPKCSDVTVNASGAFIVPGGIVRGIRHDDASVRARDLASASVIPRIYAGPAATGDGSGLDNANLTTLDQAMSWWRATTPSLVEIVLSAGTHTVSPGAFSLPSAADTVGRKLILSGPGATVAGASTMRLPASASISGVAMPSINVEIRGGDLALANTSLASVTAIGTSVTLAGTVSLSPAARNGLQIEGGDLVIRSGSVLSGIASPSYSAVYLADGARLSLAGAIALSPSSGAASALTVASSSHATVYAGTLAAGGASSVVAVQTGGSLVLDGGASLGNGLVGVNDLGGSFIAGSSATVSSVVQCWSGGLFEFSAASSAPSAPSFTIAPNPTLPASIAPGQEIDVSALAARLRDDAATAARHAVLSTLNRSSWTCTP